MTQPEYRRRKDDEKPDSTQVRLALLERSYFENKDSLAAVHKRITDMKSEVKEDMRLGFQEMKDTLIASAKGCFVCKEATNKRVSSLEGWRNVLTGAYIVGTAVIAALWDNYIRGGHKQ